MSKRLEQAYDPEEFRKLGHQLVDQIANQLENSLSQKTRKTIPWQEPNTLLEEWKKNTQQDIPISDIFQKLLDQSIQLHHPKYIGHQVSVPAPVATLASLVSSYLNNGMAVYEMGMVSSALEKIITDQLAQLFGMDENAAGILTSGGTLANLTAMLSARKAKSNEYPKEKLALLVSEQAHYCIERAVMTMGWDIEGIIKIPVDKNFKIRIDLLEIYYQTATKKGFKVMAIVGSACSTSTGSYDDLNALADFAEKHNLWFHVDGAHGAAVVYSDKYKHYIDGIEKADSIVLDFHKLLMTPALATALIYKNKIDSFHTFQTEAAYLLNLDQDWYNTGKRTYECTKLMMSIKVYSIIKAHGIQIFGENVDRLYDRARSVEKIINAHPKFEMAIPIQSNIICFRLIKKGLNENELNILNKKIRQELLEDGEFYIVQTVLDSRVYLRLTVMNPFTNEADVKLLLEKIVRIGSSHLCLPSSDIS